jgi:CRISPR-associated helicase Cas3/CRISPR-associated endonuclease Cas3-HD
VHDVGKLSPAFACQVDTLADHLGKHGFKIHPSLKKDPSRSQVNHALVGHLAVRDWLVHKKSFSLVRATQLAGIVGSHHGVTPENSRLSEVKNRKDLAGTGVWARTREHVLERATGQIGGAEVLARYRECDLSLPVQALLTAIVIVADWIASNDEFFPLQAISTVDDQLTELNEYRLSVITARRLETGWSILNFPPRWTARLLTGDLDQVFRDRFNPKALGIRQVQAVAVEAAKEQKTPGLIIIEAPMGSGKTEAAFLAAEQLAATSGADGCFLALPTQATSNAMFDRALQWTKALPGRDSGSDVSVYLAHGKSALNDKFEGLVRSGRFRGIGDEDEWLIAHDWLSGRKKGVLAAFVVGTIDQVLFAGLKSRHLMLRHLALAGKVVILDEVHAYDVYMSQYLHRVLHWLGAYGVPVVLLSATLPAAKRAELLSAYQSGKSAGQETATELAVDPGYPVVLSSEGKPSRSVELSADSMRIDLDHLPDDPETIVRYLQEHLADGGCAVVTRNTVARVQDTAGRLIKEFGAEHVTVNHARFLNCDRARIDQDLLRRFGPPGEETERPRFHIVVASQVVEQSLDVDFDLMITDLAPVDLVLQRVGRLHRHQRARPPLLSRARCALVGVEDWHVDPPVPVSGSRSVYGEYALLRSAALLAPLARDKILLPEDISPLVQSAYGESPLGPASWQPAMEIAHQLALKDTEDRTNRAQEFLLGKAREKSETLIGWIRNGTGDADDDRQGVAQVRDTKESLEVVVVQCDTDGGLMTADWIGDEGGQQIPLDQAMSSRQARVIAACGLRLPPALCHPGVIDDVIAALELNNFSSFHQLKILKGQLVLVFDQDRVAKIRHGRADFRLAYDLQRGLIHEQR